MLGEGGFVEADGDGWIEIAEWKEALEPVEDECACEPAYEAVGGFDEPRRLVMDGSSR